MVCRGMGGWGATPEPTRCFLALCSSKTPILGVQKHPFWLVVCSGMGVWSDTPEPTAYFLTWCISNTAILGIQKHSFWLVVCSGMGVWSATPGPTGYFWHGAVQRHPSQGSENTASGMWFAVVWVFGARPQDPKDIF